MFVNSFTTILLVLICIEADNIEDEEDASKLKVDGIESKANAIKEEKDLLL